MSRAPHRCLVIGGARSGKSSWAEARFAGEPIRYLATGYPAGADAEWAQRLQRHRDRRPAAWRTLETLDVAEALADGGSGPLLVDCVTLWLTRTLDAAGAWDAARRDAEAMAQPAVDGLVAAVRGTPGEAVLVTNDVGSGIVPDSAGSRLFADLLGETNTALAAVCDEVVLMVAGIPVALKGGPPPWRMQ